jgi:hypothetical protein
MNTAITMNNVTRKDKITSFFKPVSAAVHELNSIISQQKLLIQMEEAEKEKEVKRKAAQEKTKESIVATILRRLEAAKTPKEPDTRTMSEKILDEIDLLADAEMDIFIPQKRKVWNGRGDGWKAVAEYAQTYGDDRTIRDFPEMFLNCKPNAAKMRLFRWKKDLGRKKNPTRHRPPDYGDVVDEQLLQKFDIRRTAGLAVDDVTLHFMLRELLQEHGLTGLLKENGGKNTFGRAWAYRFFKRHNISTRICTTKMRELPEDFEAKKEEYIRVGAMLIDRY